MISSQNESNTRGLNFILSKNESNSWLDLNLSFRFEYYLSVFSLIFALEMNDRWLRSFYLAIWLPYKYSHCIELIFAHDSNSNWVQNCFLKGDFSLWTGQNGDISLHTGQLGGINVLKSFVKHLHLSAPLKIYHQN